MALLVALSFLRTARAQILTLTLANPNQTGTPGGNPVVFAGTLTNAGSVPIVLDGSAYNFTPPAPGFDVTDDPAFLAFLVNGGELAPGQAYNGALFQVQLQSAVVPDTVADGTATFTGSYVDDFGGSVSTSASSGFRVTAASGFAVPEPGTLGMYAAVTPATFLYFTRFLRRGKAKRLKP